MSELSLDGCRMHVVETASNGVVNADTYFDFHQGGDRAWAEYAGGGIERGYLVGVVRGSDFEFRYCQIQTDGVIDGGQSRCELRRSDAGKLQIVEHFEWGSREGGGTNVFEEVLD